MKKLVGMVVVVLLTAAFLAAPVLAGEATLNVLAPWQGQGQVFKVGPNKIKLVGSFEGIMYIENGQGDLDAALMNCAGVEYIDVDTQKATLKADCVITKSDDKVAYATLTASGKIGEMKGSFVITGGEGKWKGISGEGDIFIRTVMGKLAINKQTGETVRSALGLAIWPELKVRLP